MSTGNAAAAVGLANTVKIPSIGAYVQDILQPVAPGNDGPYIGSTGPTYWNYNWLGEDVGFLAPSTSGVLGTTNVGPTPPNTGASDVGNPLGKRAQWCTNAVALTVPADGRVTVTAGVAVAASGTGLYKTFVAPATVMPIGSFFWAFEV